MDSAEECSSFSEEIQIEVHWADRTRKSREVTEEIEPTPTFYLPEREEGGESLAAERLVTEIVRRIMQVEVSGREDAPSTHNLWIITTWTYVSGNRCECDSDDEQSHKFGRRSNFDSKKVSHFMKVIFPPLLGGGALIF